MTDSAPGRALNALRRLVGALVESARELEREAGVTPAQLFVLQVLAEGPMPTVNALAARTHTTQATVSTVLSRLEKRALVTRTPHAGDRRRSVVALTAAGRRLLDRTTVPVQVRLTSALVAMPARKRRQLADSLEAWVADAGLEAVPAGMFLEPARPARRRSARR